MLKLRRQYCAFCRGSSREKQVDTVNVSLPCRVVDRCPSELVLGVHVGASLQEDVDRFGVAFTRGMIEGSCLRVLVGNVDAREAASRFDEQAENAGVPFASGEMLRPVPSGVGEDLGSTVE